MLKLRKGQATTLTNAEVSPGKPLRISGVQAPSAHLKLALQPGQGCTAAGLVLRSWLMEGSEAGSQPTAAVLLVNWAESRLEVGLITTSNLFAEKMRLLKHASLYGGCSGSWDWDGAGNSQSVCMCV